MDLKEFYRSPHLLEQNIYTDLKLKKLGQFFPKNKKVLDYGCGDGTITQIISKENKVIGIDISPNSIKICRKKGIDCRLIEPDKKLDFQDSYFDCIFLLETIEHIFDTEFLLKELKRILRKDGTLIVSTPNLANFSNRARFLFDLKLHYTEVKIEAGHIRFFTKNSLEKILEENGFKIEKTSSNYVYFPVIGQISFLGDLFPSIGTELIVKAVKK